MKFLHYQFEIPTNGAVEVTLDKQANVRLLDDSNYVRYKHGQSHQYHGGLAKVSPVTLRPPHPGRWNLVIDLGGFVGTVRASVRLV